MDASSKSGESTDSQPSRSDSQADSQKLSQQEKTLQASSSSSPGTGSLIGSSQSSVGGTLIRTPTPPKRNLSPQSSFSQDVTNSSTLISASRTLSTTSAVVEGKTESPSASPTSKSSGNNTSVTLISGKATPAPGISTIVTSSINQCSNTITLSSSSSGMKRPPSDTSTSVNQNMPLATENPDSDSSGDPKRKKMRKELKTETVDIPVTGMSSSSNVGTASLSSNSASRGTRGAAGNKQGKLLVASTPGSSGAKGPDKPSTSTSPMDSPANSAGISSSCSDSSFNRADTNSAGSAISNSGISTSWEGQSQAIDTSESSSNSTEESSVSFSGSRVKQTEAGSSTSVVGGTNSGNSGNGCPKVPPIKIVLQSHAHGNINAGHCLGSSGNAGSNAPDSESTTSTQHATSTGFPYVVSSTTDNSSSTNVNPTTSTASAGVSSVPTTGSTSSARGTNPSETSRTNENLQTTSTLASNASAPVSSTSNVTVPQDISSTDQQAPVTIVPTTTTQSESISSNVHTQSFVAVTSSSVLNSGVGMSVNMAYASPNLTTASTTSMALASQPVHDKSGLNSSSVTLSAPSGANPLLNVADRDKEKPFSVNKDSGSTPAGNLLSNTGGKDDRMKDSTGLKASTCYTQAGASTMLSTSVLMSVSGGSSSSSGSFTDDKEKEKPQRVTRSSQRMAHNNNGPGGNAGGCSNSASSSSGGTPSSPQGAANSPKNSNCPSPSQQENGNQPNLESSSFHAKQQEIQEKLDAADNSNVDVHPRKRKIKVKEVTPANSSSSSTSGEINDVVQNHSSNQTHDQPILNCFEMYLNIRKQIERRRKNLFPVTPKPPQGFKDYLMNRGTYVLASNDKSRVAIPLLNPPSNLPALVKETFIEQEKERHKLRIQHLVEKEKLVLSVEQEILRVHGRAARALSNQALPFSVCTILKDQEVYNLLTPEQEEKDRNARSRYNGRLFLSWLQDVDDKWDKIKESMLLRHHNEAESLHAVQKMDWEWKLKEVGLCEPKAAPSIDDIQVPMVHVSDDFDLLPA